MIGMPFQTLQGKGVLQVAGFGSIEKWNKVEEGYSSSSVSNNEPTSVLDTRRSPSPPTSTSTLASSFGGGGSGGATGGGGGGVSTDNSSAVAVSDQKWPISEANQATAAELPTRKDEWAAELQPITTGLGVEDWESMLSDSGGQEHSLLRWIAGDVEDPSFGLKQLLQGGGNPLEFDCNAGLGIMDHGTGFESVIGAGGGGSTTGNLITTINNSSIGFSPSGFPPNNNNNSNGKIGSITQNSGVVNYKVSGVGLSQNPNIFPSQTNNLVPLPVSLPSTVIFQQQFETPPDEKPQIFNLQQVLMNQQQQSQNPNFFPGLPYAQQDPHHHLLQPLPKRQNSGGVVDPSSQIPKVPFADLGHEFLLRKQQQQQQQQQHHPLGFPNQLQLLAHAPPPHSVHQKPPSMVPKQKMMGPGEELAQHHQQQQQQQQALLDQLFKAAELVGTGNFSHAQGILARLNHQLSNVGKPLQRAAFYFKEALQLILRNNPVTSPLPGSPSPFDVIFKMSAYKVFSEVSPLIQFANFTCNQALLEALDDADRIHIIDFDIGFGAQWSSFMQELPVRNRGAPALKITAFALPSTHHPLELELLRENLTLFADEIGIAFELDVVNLDSFDLNSYSLPIFRSSENEAIVVNFPIWASSNNPAMLPSLLRFVKHLSPKIIVSLDRGCDRSDLPFSQHLLQALQSYTNLLESLDAVNAPPDAVNKIEKFLLQPRIESTVLGRLRALEKMPLWKQLFASAGFSPVTFSNFTETQAECVVKKTPVRGFHVEKRQASLVLCWQRRELISASAWRC